MNNESLNSALDTETLKKEEELKNALLNDESAKNITAKRGRLIRQLKKEIKNIKSSTYLSEEDKNNLKRLEELLNTELDNHKKQLSNRYKDEFLKAKATVPSIFTVLPKGVVLQVKKVVNCINELKQAKGVKEHILNFIELTKSVAMVAATPVVFTAKFIADHWYIVLSLISWLKNIILQHSKKKDKSNDNNDLDNKKLDQATNTNVAYDQLQSPEVPITGKNSKKDLPLLPEDKESLIEKLKEALLLVGGGGGAALATAYSLDSDSNLNIGFPAK